MSFEFEAAETLAPETNRLSTPGKFHLCVTDVRTETKKGESIDGFEIECDVMAGTAEGCEGKTLALTLYNPSGDNETGRRIAQQRQTAFFIATCQINPNDLGKSVKLELNDAVGRQIVVDIDHGKKKENGQLVSTKYMQVVYSNIYHVDDPEVKDVPKSKDALELIDPSQRKPESYFAFKAPKNAPKAEPKKQDWKDVDL